METDGADRRLVSAAKRATRETKRSGGEWSGQPVDRQAAPSSVAGSSQGQRKITD
jgi:hypothetical protein